MLKYLKPSESSSTEEMSCTDSSFPSEKSPASRDTHLLRRDSKGWDKDTVKNRLKNMARYPPKGDWRRISEAPSAGLKVRYTIAIAEWKYREKTCIIKHLVPYGMYNAAKSILLYKKNTCFSVLRSEIVEYFGLTKENYNRNEMSVSISNNGDQGIRSFTWIYCRICVRNVCREIYISNMSLTGQGLEDDKDKVAGIIEKWDTLKISQWKLDAVDCILPEEADVHVGPVGPGRYIITEPGKHAERCHNPI